MRSGQGAGHPDEDELYEAAIVSTNIVYEVINDELILLPEISETMAKIEILDPSKVCNFVLSLLAHFCPLPLQPVLFYFLAVGFRLW